MHHANMPRIGLLGIFFCHSALAAETTHLAVVGVHDAELTPQQQEKIIQEISETVDASGKARAIHGEQVAIAIQGREQIVLREALLNSGNTALQNGKNLYNQALPDEAAPVLEMAIRELEQGIVGANVTKDLWEAYLYLGSSQLGLDNADAATRAFAAAAALSDSRAPSPAVFPPFVIEAFEAARAQISGSRTDLVITVPDSGATVYLNGEEQGQGSLTLSGVLPGTHHILARGDGTQAYRVVEVPIPEGTAVPDAPAPDAPAPDAPAPDAPPSSEGTAEALPQLEVSLELGVPVLGTASETAPGRSRQIGSLYRALGEHSEDVDLYLLAGINEEWLHLQLYAPRADTFSKQVEIKYGGDTASETVQALPLLLNLLDKNGDLPTTATVPTAAPLDIGANTELAMLLTQPRPTTATPSAASSGKKKVWGVVAGIATASVLAGGGYATYALVTRDGGAAGSGTIVVGPF